MQPTRSLSGLAAFDCIVLKSNDYAEWVICTIAHLLTLHFSIFEMQEDKDADYIWGWKKS